jgi:aryl-alcohol dehydrogenase-like predicted oxidoreductase
VSSSWSGVRFGLGLLEIGKAWGRTPSPVPGDEEALEFLSGAYASGVRLFDTAASYAASEARFGRFLRSLAPAQVDDITVATKFGEHWDNPTGAPYVDHSYDSLMRSLDASLHNLGRIDILQVHKASVEALRSRDLRRALAGAKAMGVGILGASVSDLEAAQLAVSDGLFQLLQFPFNKADRRFQGVLEETGERGIMAFVNRPLKMGELIPVDPAESTDTLIRDCIASILEVRFDGAILFGTRSLDHLRQNLEAFSSLFAER